MDVLPLGVAAVPDAGLLRLHGAWHAAGVHVLGEADVSDARSVVADQVHVGVEQDGVDGPLLSPGQSWMREADWREMDRISPQSRSLKLLQSLVRNGMQRLYRSQSRICGSRFPPIGFPKPLAQRM